jgi:tetratricopeptide (TPR) repeat protein
MPIGIFLYEIDDSFGPNILAEYYLTEDVKVSQNLLKEFIEKHIERELIDATVRKDELKYYSSKINAESLNKGKLYLGFILRDDEELVSLKSVFENTENSLIQNFSTDKGKLTELLKINLTSILSLMEKLKEPKIITETINEKTKKMLDEGKFEEARELIDLGEKIPEKLSADIKLADQFFKEKQFKKAKKNFEKAAELAETIQEKEIYSFLMKKAEKIGLFPDMLKERDLLQKSIKKEFIDLTHTQLKAYERVIPTIDKVINISNSLEDEKAIETSIEIQSDLHKASELYKELAVLDKKIKRLLLKM